MSSNISHMHIFGDKYFVLNNMKDNLDKFAKFNKDIFLRYFIFSKTFSKYNK